MLKIKLYALLLIHKYFIFKALNMLVKLHFWLLKVFQKINKYVKISKGRIFIFEKYVSNFKNSRRNWI